MKGQISMPSDDKERSQRARIAALSRVAQEPSGTAMTEKARSKFWQSFYDKTDPQLPEQERVRQADAARRLHMTRLSHKAALARRRLAAAQTAAVDAEAEAIAASGDAV
jgi:uncharacterized membrane protein YqiK